MLQQSGLRLACWTRRFRYPGQDPEQVYAKLARDLSASAILLLRWQCRHERARGTTSCPRCPARLLDDVAARQLVTVTGSKHAKQTETTPYSMGKPALPVGGPERATTGRAASCQAIDLCCAARSAGGLRDGAIIARPGAAGDCLLGVWQPSPRQCRAVAGDAPPRGVRFRGVELVAREVACGNAALQPLFGNRVSLVAGDMRQP